MAKQMHPAEKHVLKVALSQIESHHIKTDDWEFVTTRLGSKDQIPNWEFVSRKSAVKLCVAIGSNGIYAHSLWKWNEYLDSSLHCLEDFNDWPKSNP